MLFDVAVIGAGPAGACAALELARSGASVVILEKECWPRYKTCGGGVVGRAARLFPCDISPAIESECRVAELGFLQSGLRFEVRRSEPIVSMTMRSRLDALVVSAATVAGAELRAPCAASGIVERAGHLEIGTIAGSVPAKAAVIASGAGRALLRDEDVRRPRRSVPALEWEVSADTATLRRFEGRARFDLEAVPAGYAWVFPKGDHLSAGILSFRRSADLVGSLERYLVRVGVSGVQKIERHGFVIPSGPAALARGRALLAGDAAGLVDPVTCEGISWAARSGRLAARALIASRFRPGDARRRYVSSITREIRGELRAARLLSTVLYRLPRLRRRLFRRHGQALCEAMTDVVCGDLSYRELLARPRSYLKLTPSPRAPPRRSGALPSAHRSTER